MNKQALHKQLISALEDLNLNARHAAMQARDTATNKESVAENKYDTFGLEASYLAHGQAKRVAEYENDLRTYQLISAVEFDIDAEIEVGALIKLIDERELERYLFLGPAAGGLKFHLDEIEISVITPSSPLGKALVGCSMGDEVKVMISGNNSVYNIVAIS